MDDERERKPSPEDDDDRPRREGLAGRFEWLVARTAFPLVFGGALYAAIARMDAGVAPEQAILPSLLLSYVAVASLERVLFWRRSWLHSTGDLRVDIGHLIVSGILTVQILTVPVTIASVALASWLSGQTGGTLWPNHWNLWLQLPLALVFGEFFLYWIHRATHEVPLLWRFHSIHHSAPRLYFLNAVRFHPVDLALSNFAPLVPLILVGADPPIIALHGLVSGVHGLFQHANVVLKLGPLNHFFSMAELHRWHHSPVLEESNTNFGQNLIVWDTVFGTRFLPQDREPPGAIGMDSLPDFPMDYWGQLTAPIHWAEIEARNTRGGERRSMGLSRSSTRG